MLTLDESGNPSTPMAAPTGLSQGSFVATRLYSSMFTNTSTKVLVGYGFPGATTVTHAMLAETEAPYTAVSVILANTSSEPLTIKAVYAAAPTRVDRYALTVYNNTVQGTFQGQKEFVLAPGTPENPTWYVTDPIPLASVNRRDGGVRPLVLFAVQTATSADGATQVGSWYRGGGNERTLTHAGQRVLGVSAFPQASTPSQLGALNTAAASFIPGFVYRADRRVTTVMEVGNSIVAGNMLSTLPDPVANRGHLIRAAEAVSSPEQPIEYMVLGLPGAGTPTYRALASKILGLTSSHKPNTDAFMPTMLLYHPFDTNANVNGNIDLAPMRAQLAAMKDSAAAAGVPLVLMDGLPRQPSRLTETSAWLNDAERISLNSELASGDVPVLPIAALLESEVNPSLFNSTLVYADGVHPNMAGDNKIKDALIDMLKN